MYGVSAGDSRLLDHHRECLRATGFTIHVLVFDGLPVTYTIGAQDKLGYELMLVGVQPHVGMTYLVEVANYVSACRRSSGSFPEDTVVLPSGMVSAPFSVEHPGSIPVDEFNQVFNTAIALGRRPNEVRHVVALLPRKALEPLSQGMRMPSTIRRMALRQKEDTEMAEASGAASLT